MLAHPDLNTSSQHLVIHNINAAEIAKYGPLTNWKSIYILCGD